MNLSLLLILTIGLGLGWSRPLRLGPGTVNPEPPEWDDIALGFFRTSECVRCLDTCARMDVSRTFYSGDLNDCVEALR